MCLPSRREAFGIVLLEAIVARTPIVAARMGGIPEVVRHDADAILVDPDDPGELARALRGVLTDRSLANRLTESAFVRYREHFSAAAFKARYHRLFETLLSE